MLFNRWNWKMAWRDTRTSRSRLLIFVSSIILGIAALVAIQSFRESLEAKINTEAKNLLGADMVVRSSQPFSDTIQPIIDSLGGKRAAERSFASMILHPENGNTRLVNTRALGGDFPFYGQLETIPPSAGTTFRTGRKTLVERSVLLQLGAQVGDSLRIGEINFLVEGEIVRAPGQAGIAATVAPPVYIPLQDLEATGLITFGSRVTYYTYLQFDKDTDIAAMAETLEPKLRPENGRVETVEGRRERVGEAFGWMNNFLNLVGFVALLLGCIGVASAVHVYIKEKLATVAILRCMGVKGGDAFAIFLIQIIMMGAIGAIIGAASGTALQLLLPKVLSNFLVFDVDFVLSWNAIFTGLITGLLIAVLFALLPMMAIRKVSPVSVLNTFSEQRSSWRDGLAWLLYTLILLTVFGFATWLMGGWFQAMFFTIGLLVLSGLLVATGKGLTYLIRKFFPVSWSYVWRQGLANLFRPDNQTMILTVTIGLGTTLLAMLFFIQHNLLSQVSGLDAQNQPNLLLFDIKKEQTQPIADLTEKHGMPVLQQVPIVTMRLESIKGIHRETIREDTTSEIPKWVLNHEYRVTYRDTLSSTETLLEGDWVEAIGPNDPVQVSIDKGLAEDMQVEVGDKIAFNVQGMVMEVAIANIRQVDWNRVQTNFMVVFPKGVLEDAPQFFALVTRSPNPETSAAYQRDLVTNFPNVSAIDLETILQTAREVFRQVSFVIQFMALFSVLTGLIVLIGSVINSKFQRIKESVLLRTLGAKRKQIIQITLVEYTALGIIASLTGVLLSIAGSWALSTYVFQITFHPDWWATLWITAIITTLTILIGLLNTRQVVQSSPLEVLRKEV